MVAAAAAVVLTQQLTGAVAQEHQDKVLTVESLEHLERTHHIRQAAVAVLGQLVVMVFLLLFLAQVVLVFKAQ